MTANLVENDFDICSTTTVSLHAGFKSVVSQAGVAVTNSQAKHQLTLIDELPSKYQKDLQGNRLHPKLSAIPSKSNGKLTWSSIDMVIESYRSAARDGRLNSDREPWLLSNADGPPKASLWDPYILNQYSVRHALLDEKKLQKIEKGIESITKIVPKANEWDAKVRDYKLTPEDVQIILQTAFAQSSKQPEQDDKLSHTLKVAGKVLHRANELKNERGNVGRAETVLRMIAYALMQVSEVAGESNVELVAGCGKKWLKQSGYFARVWVWLMGNLPRWNGRELPLFFILMEKYGESALRAFFQSTVPATAGEFVSALSSEEYWRGLPATRSPGLIHVVMVLLDGCVTHEVIGSAFGCSASYLECLDQNLFSEVLARPTQPKIFWEEVTAALGRQDQTKKDDGLSVGVNDVPDNYESGVVFENLFFNFDIACGITSSPSQQG